jgi:hypothetical protein
MPRISFECAAKLLGDTSGFGLWGEHGSKVTDCDGRVNRYYVYTGFMYNNTNDCLLWRQNDGRHLPRL